MKNKTELLIHVVLGFMFGLVLIHIAQIAQGQNIQASANFKQVGVK